MLSSKVTCNYHGQDSSYFLGWEEYEKNPFDEVKNPNGIIQMGLAENQLSFDLLESWLQNNPQPAAFKNDKNQSIFRELALFQDYNGLPAFKNVSFYSTTDVYKTKSLLYILPHITNLSCHFYRL